MTTLLIGLLIFIDLFIYIVIFDVILSWLALFGVKRPAFIGQLLDPIYDKISEYIPTNFGPLSFSAIIVILLCYFTKGLIVMIDPMITSHYSNLLNSF